MSAPRRRSWVQELWQSCLALSNTSRLPAKWSAVTARQASSSGSQRAELISSSTVRGSFAGSYSISFMLKHSHLRRGTEQLILRPDGKKPHCVAVLPGDTVGPGLKFL